MAQQATAVIATRMKVAEKVANLGTIAYDNISLNALIKALTQLRKDKIKQGFDDFMIEEGKEEIDGCTYFIVGSRIETPAEQKRRIKNDQVLADL